MTRLKSLILCSVLLPAAVQAEDYQITVERKKTAFTQSVSAIKGAKSSGGTPNEQVQSQKWKGEVKVRNASRKESQALDARYLLVVKRQQLGQKAGKDEFETVKGESKIEPLKSMTEGGFQTKEVELLNRTLLGNFYVANGGLNKSMDDVSGVWIKLFENGKEVGEYVNPPTIKSKYKLE